jgi:hypothetical protein
MPWSPERRTSAGIASLVFGVLCPCVYLIERLFERLRSGSTNPSLIISEVHAAFYWRCTLAVWFSGLVVWLMIRNRSAADPRQAPGWIIPCLLAVAPLAILWALRFP